MKRKVFILFLSICSIITGSSAYAQNNLTSETWSLDNTKLFIQKNGNSYSQIDYSKSEISLINQPYESIAFSGSNCEATINGGFKISGKFTLENNQLVLSLRALPETIDISWNNDGSVVFTKMFSDVNKNDNTQSNQYKMVLTYKKK